MLDLFIHLFGESWFTFDRFYIHSDNLAGVLLFV